jgi:hypothetical protein
MRTKTFTVVLAAALVATVATTAQARPTSGILGCTKLIAIDGHEAIEFCGPATGLAHVGSHSGRYHGGSCVTAAGRFAVNIGISATPGEVTPLPDWLNITTLITPKAGPQAVSISLVLDGKGYAIVKGMLDLASTRKSGSFTGLTGANPFLNPTVKVQGSFSC